MSGAEDLVRNHGMTAVKGLAVAGVGGAIATRFLSSSASAEAPAKEGHAVGKKIFGRPGPVFQTLSLQSAEDVTSNTKLLRFSLPGETDISGLPLTCKSPDHARP